MAEADLLCDRIALLHEGVLQAVGAPADLKAALGPGATLEDVFRHHAGAGLGAGGPEDGGSGNHEGPPGRRGGRGSNNEGGLRGVRSTRRTAQRAG
jgi:ABC-2 type transport system ATP-binding protein